MFRFVIEHFVTYWADKECERFIPFVDQDVGKLLLYEPNLVNAAGGWIRVLEFEALFGHWRCPVHLFVINARERSIPSTRASPMPSAMTDVSLGVCSASVTSE